MWQMWYMKWRTAEFHNSRKTEEKSDNRESPSENKYILLKAEREKASLLFLHEILICYRIVS